MDNTPGPDDDAGVPRWVKTSGAVVVALVVALVITHLMGGNLGGHTP